MDGQKEADKPVAPPAETPAAAEPSQAAPAKPEHHRKFFMDVHKPKGAEKPEVKEQESAAPAIPPTAPKPVVPAPAENLPDEMPTMEPAPAEKAVPTDDPAKTLEEPKKEKPPKVTKPPKPPRQAGVGFAIFATILIVLGLAALATYAYLRTNNISVL